MRTYGENSLRPRDLLYQVFSFRDIHLLHKLLIHETLLRVWSRMESGVVLHSCEACLVKPVGVWVREDLGPEIVEWEIFVDHC